MPNILFIAAHRLHRSPSQRYRYEQYLDFLKTNGYAYTHSNIISEKDDAVFYSPGRVAGKASIVLKSLGKRVRDWSRFNQYDIIFIQREALMLGSSFFEKKAFKSKAKVVFDFDDSIWLMDTSPGNKKLEFLKNPNKTQTNIAHAHLVIAGNDYLADFARQFNNNVVVIPTTIDTNVHIPMHEKRHKDQLIIGWSGSISTIKHFEGALPYLKILKERYGDKIAFRVLGDAAYENKTLDIRGIRWEAATEVQNLNSFDIGIMPLPDDKWAKGKCGLKGLSYMACEVPPVMSPVGVNTKIIQDGHNGFLASTPEEWVQAIGQLIEKPELRKHMGEQARKTVIETYSVEANKRLYLEALNSLIH